MDMDTRKDILVVDDNENILKLITEVAHTSGIQVRTASNAEDFFNAYTDKTPGLMMLDIVMPDMDGLEMVQKLTALNSRVPLVIMSGYNYVDDQGIKLLTKQLNLIKFLHKPFDVQELIELFSSTVDTAH